MTRSSKKSEYSVAQRVRLDCSEQFRTVLFRNNVGVFEAKSGQWVRYGLANESKEMNKNIKSSDYIGMAPVVITPEMVGRTVAVFTAIETKKEGYKPSGKAQAEHHAAQQRFCDLVLRNGGIAGIVDSSEKAVELIKEWLAQANEKVQ